VSLTFRRSSKVIALSGGVCYAGDEAQRNSESCFMTDSFDVTPKTTEQNLIVRIDKSEAEVCNNERVRWRYCTVEANY